MKTNKTICVIDDEEIIQFIIKTVVTGLNSSLSILAFKNGEEALQAFLQMQQNELPDLILLDINMPVMGGWQFLDEYVTIPITKKPPIYILSSSNAPGDKIRAKVYKNIVGYINKPIEVEILKQIAQTELDI